MRRLPTPAAVLRQAALRLCTRNHTATAATASAQEGGCVQGGGAAASTPAATASLELQGDARLMARAAATQNPLMRETLDDAQATGPPSSTDDLALEGDLDDVNVATAATGGDQRTDLASIVAQLSRLTFASVSKMGDQAVYETVRRYLLTMARLDHLGGARSRTVRLRARLVRKQLRLERSTRQLLFLRLGKSVEDNRIPVDLAARLLAVNWPLPLGQALNHVKAVVSARIISLTHRTQTTANTTPSDVDGTGTLTPGRARTLLVACAKGFPLRVDIVGPLATIGFADIDHVTNAEEIIECMWAVHTARTNAPDSFWRRAVGRLVALQRDSTSKGGGAVPSPSAAPSGGTPLTVRQIFRALRVVKLEHWSGDIGQLSFLVSEALREVLHVFQTHPERQLFERAPAPRRPEGFLSHSQDGQEIERRVAECTQGLTPTGLLSLLVIAGDLGHTFQAGFAAMSDGILAPMVHHLSTHSDMQLLCEMLRVTRNHTPSLYQAVMDSLVRLNGVQHQAADRAAVATAVSSWRHDDALDDTLAPAAAKTPTAATSSPDAAARLMPFTIPIVELVVREVVRAQGLAEQLQLRPFLQLMLVVAREKRKFSPSTILSLTDNMYLLHRHLSKASNLGAELRMAVDEFAYQMERLLQHAVVSVDMVNRFLEFSIMLGMKGDATAYPSTAALRAARDALYQRHHKELGHRFHGVIPSHPARTHVIDVYQELFQATMQLGFYHRLLSKATLRRLKARTFHHGVLAALGATCVYKTVHYERPGALEHPTVYIPHVVQQTVLDGVVDRIRSCALAEPAAMHGVEDAAVRERLRLVLRLPDGLVVDRVVAAMVVDAAVSSPLSLQLARDKEFVHFILVLVRSPSCGTDTLRMQVQQWVRAANEKGGRTSGSAASKGTA